MKIVDFKTSEAAAIDSGATFSSAKPMEVDTISKNGRRSKNHVKKFLGFLLIVMIGFAACEGPMGLAGIDGIDGRDGTNGRNGTDGTDGKDGASANWLITDFTVLSDHWIDVSDDLMGDLFVYEFQLAELTEFVFEQGTVVCHLLQTVNSEAVQTPLPYTFYGEDAGYYYSENYTYEIRPRFITFLAKISDFSTVQKPLSCKFRVVLMW